MNTPTPIVESQNHERIARAPSGWFFLLVTLLMLLSAPLLLVQGIRSRSFLLIIAAVLLFVTAVVMACGFFTLQPNEAAVLVLFGAYKGTVRESGFFFTNPLNKKFK